MRCAFSEWTLTAALECPLVCREPELDPRGRALAPNEGLDEGPAIGVGYEILGRDMSRSSYRSLIWPGHGAASVIASLIIRYKLRCGRYLMANLLVCVEQKAKAEKGHACSK